MRNYDVLRKRFVLRVSRNRNKFRLSCSISHERYVERTEKFSEIIPGKRVSFGILPAFSPLRYGIFLRRLNDRRKKIRDEFLEIAGFFGRSAASRA